MRWDEQCAEWQGCLQHVNPNSIGHGRKVLGAAAKFTRPPPHVRPGSYLGVRGSERPGTTARAVPGLVICDGENGDRRFGLHEVQVGRGVE